MYDPSRQKQKSKTFPPQNKQGTTAITAPRDYRLIETILVQQTRAFMFLEK